MSYESKNVTLKSGDTKLYPTATLDQLISEKDSPTSFLTQGGIIKREFLPSDVTPIRLIASTPPNPYFVGDKYFDTSSNKVKTAYVENSVLYWSEGTEPTSERLFINLADNKIYHYHNNSMSLVGGAVTGISTSGSGGTAQISLVGGSGSVSLIQGNNVTISRSGSTITISATDTQGATGISSSVSDGTASITLVNGSGSVKLKQGDNVTLSQDGDSILISANGSDGVGATGINSSVSGNTATVSLVGGTGSVKFVGSGNTNVSTNNLNEIIIGSTFTEIYQDLSSHVTGSTAFIELSGSTSSVKIKQGSNVTISQDGDSILISANGSDGVGATGINSSVSNGTATITLSGATGSVLIVGSGNTSISTNESNQIVIGSTSTVTYQDLDSSVSNGTATISLTGSTSSVKIKQGNNVTIAQDGNEIKISASDNKVVQILAISAIEPTTHTSGERYYNSSSKKIHTSVLSNGSLVWGEGEVPDGDVLYLNLSDNKLYHYQNGDMVLVSATQSARLTENIDFYRV